MNLLEILQPQCVKAPLSATDKRGVINELIDCLAGTGRVSDAGALKDAVWSREMTRTTGIGHGLAIPHGKSPSVSALTMAIGKPAEPIDFQAIDGRPVRLVILLASPPDKTADHIQALARVSRLMHVDAFREAVYAAGSGAEVYELLRQQEQKS